MSMTSQRTILDPTTTATVADPPFSPPPVEGVVADGSTGFAARLREATKTVHREAERSGFIADLIRGRATREGYAVYLRNLVPVYAALEAGLDVLARPSALLAPFADLALRRLPALRADLEAIAGAGSAGACPLLPETEAYARSIFEADEPRLAAHAYARYLGDLSGGQILGPLLVRSLGLGPTSLAFYAFPLVADIEVPKRAIRAALDTVPAKDAMADDIVAEATAAFRHNIAVSTALSDALRAVPAQASNSDLA